MSSFLIWWMKRDLRLADNAALSAAHRKAIQLNLPLLALWIDEPEAKLAPDYHPRRERFVTETLAELHSSLGAVGIHLCIARGPADAVFQTLATLGLRNVFSHEETGLMWTYRRDLRLKNFFSEKKIEWSEFPNNGIVRRLKSRNDWHPLYQERMNQPLEYQPSRPTPDAVELLAQLTSLSNNQSEIFPWDSARHKPWMDLTLSWSAKQQRGGEKIGLALLERFLQPEIHRKYLFSISKPKEAQTFSSRLSPYLAYGCLSSRQILTRVSSLSQERSLDGRSISAFKSRLAWRSHFIQKLENFPNMEEVEQNSALRGIRPNMSVEEFERWHHGQTGFPLIDACLRSVHSTGFLNFRMRAMLMSFATHLMWRDWRVPAWDLAKAFLDFEPGIHFSQVQMQASVTGNNQIRIYNPLKQSEENDPETRFIKEWVPELREMPAEAIHQMRSLPNTYPKPIIDLPMAANFARAELFKMFSEERVRGEAKKVQEKLGSRNRRDKTKRETQKRVQKNKENESSGLTLFDFEDSKE